MHAMHAGLYILTLESHVVRPIVSLLSTCSVMFDREAREQRLSARHVQADFSHSFDEMGKKQRRIGRIERLKKTLSSKSQKLVKLGATNKELINSVAQLQTENKLVNRYLNC